ncbi:hypothetical protein [Nannocystis pusilla]|uniref:hypothetical protein n=1 Tax=Nannocystis pusilla TaxID=889268 RepID=UPI003B77DB1D
MTDESTSARALIAAYKSCARPSAAAEAQLWATLAAAERVEKRSARRPTPSLAPWLALAAGLLLFAAWQLGLAGVFASGHVLRDMRDQAAYDAAEPEPQEARTREEPAGEIRWRETVRPESGPAAAPTGVSDRRALLAARSRVRARSSPTRRSSRRTATRWPTAIACSPRWRCCRRPRRRCAQASRRLR